MLAQSAVVRLHVVRPSVCPSVCLSVCNDQVPCSHRLEFFENNQEHIKAVISPKWCKIGPRLLLRTNLGSHMRAFDWHQNQ